VFLCCKNAGLHTLLLTTCSLLFVSWCDVVHALLCTVVLLHAFLHWLILMLCLHYFNTVFLGIRRSVWPVKKLSHEVLASLTVWSEVQTIAYGPADASSSLASLKFRFWCQLSQVVLEKRTLNSCLSLSWCCAVTNDKRINGNKESVVEFVPSVAVSQAWWSTLLSFCSCCVKWTNSKTYLLTLCCHVRWICP